MKKPLPYLLVAPYGELLALLATDALREAHELDQEFEIYEEGPDYIKVRTWPDDLIDDEALEATCTATVRLVGLNPLVEGEPLLAVFLCEDEPPLVICANGKLLFDIMYC